MTRMLEQAEMAARHALRLEKEAHEKKMARLAEKERLRQLRLERERLAREKTERKRIAMAEERLRRIARQPSNHSKVLAGIRERAAVENRRIAGVTTKWEEREVAELERIAEEELAAVRATSPMRVPRKPQLHMDPRIPLQDCRPPPFRPPRSSPLPPPSTSQWDQRIPTLPPLPSSAPSPMDWAASPRSPRVHGAHGRESTVDALASPRGLCTLKGSLASPRAPGTLGAVLSPRHRAPHRARRHGPSRPHTALMAPFIPLLVDAPELDDIGDIPVVPEPTPANPYRPDGPPDLIELALSLELAHEREDDFRSWIGDHPMSPRSSQSDANRFSGSPMSLLEASLRTSR